MPSNPLFPQKNFKEQHELEQRRIQQEEMQRRIDEYRRLENERIRYRDKQIQLKELEAFLKKQENKKVQKKKNRRDVHVCFVIDESSSMYTARHETIAGFNNYINKLKLDQENEKVNIIVSVTKFNNKSQVLYTNTNVNELPALSQYNYNPSGSTALYDALGDTVSLLEAHVGAKITAAKKSKKALPKVLVVVMTDGEENCSTRYNMDAISYKIAELDKKPNWTFVYIGADQDSWKNSGAIGINALNTVNYNKAETHRAMDNLYFSTKSYLLSADSKSNNFFDGKKGI